MTDIFNLERFIEAQDGDYNRAVAELGAGQKRGHWMWYIFPQISGLGTSWMSQKYAITSRAEAEAYLAHPVLGSRLISCAKIVTQLEGRSIQEIFGSPDDLKFRSCMTLFHCAATDSSIFRDALAKYFNVVPYSLTLNILDRT